MGYVDFIGENIRVLRFKNGLSQEQLALNAGINPSYIGQIFEVCLGTPIESAVYIAAHYGLRRSEVLSLKWDCIDFEEKTISIKEVRVKIGKTVVVKKPKSESSQRILPLMEKIEDYLKHL